MSFLWIIFCGIVGAGGNAAMMGMTPVNIVVSAILGAVMLAIPVMVYNLCRYRKVHIGWGTFAMFQRMEVKMLALQQFYMQQFEEMKRQHLEAKV